ncbi:DsbA family protein [Lactobacillus sp. PV034]|uniref:DsbA family protein n=1 Tax=Lactobacillus sp. PV034 TaxID=2594495 RepID=UPI00223ED043|nr:DsbA family protein [Lactobacillus sp. PV034]QNQ80745.1 dithiol-disulfide isomerase [Lactobacillus sp. PV034]
MFEIFFFMNPLGINCYLNEKAIINGIDDSQKKVDYHFIPMANMTTIRNDLLARNLPTCDLNLFNKFSRRTFNAIKDYHAVKLIKGNKTARKFIFDLQAAVNENDKKYSKDLVNEFLQKYSINPSAFEETRMSKYVLYSMNKDSHLAKKFNVQTTPTTLFYDYDHDNCNYKIEGKVTEDDVDIVLNEANAINNSKISGQANLHLL